MPRKKITLPKASPKTMSRLEDLKAQFAELKFGEDPVNKVHTRLRGLTRRFDMPGPEMQSVERFSIAHPDYDVPVWLFVPHGADEIGPCHVYLHGGGFVTCDVQSHEGLCRRMAMSSGHRVLSVDYRLAPQYPFPAGPDDCERALLWALERAGDRGIDGGNITIGGDSAGGNMAAYLAQKYRRDLKAQVLYYPLMQLAEKRPVKKGWQDSFMLGEFALGYIDKAYVCGADFNDTRLSPLFEKNLKGLPPAYVLTCELDPLRDEGRAYAANMSNSGVEVKTHHEKAMPHGFLNFAKTFPPARTIPVEVGEFLRRACL